MATKAEPTDTDMLMSNDPLMEEFERGQRPAHIKAVIALMGLAAVILVLLIAFAKMVIV